MQEATFNNRGITMAGNLFFPADFDETKSYPAIVTVNPGGGVKEQTAGEYSERLAAQGYVTLAFDALHQGASGGEPRRLDVPNNRVVDTFSAVDYLTTLPYVDNDRIGMLGICAGGGIAVKAASLDRRVKVLATVSGIDVGSVFRAGWEGGASVADQITGLEGIAGLKTGEAAGMDPVYGTYVPEPGDTTAPRDQVSIDDYDERVAQTIAGWKSMNGLQPGDPAKLGAAPVTIAAMENPPLRFVAGADVVAGVEQRAQLLLDQVEAHRELSSNMAIDA